jgi:hypothetical protein
LGDGTGPPAVLLVVALFVIDAVERGVWWSFTHVGKEVLKLGPSLANLYVGVGWVTLAANGHFAP